MFAAGQAIPVEHMAALKRRQQNVMLVALHTYSTCARMMACLTDGSWKQMIDI